MNEPRKITFKRDNRNYSSIIFESFLKSFLKAYTETNLEIRIHQKDDEVTVSIAPEKILSEEERKDIDLFLNKQKKERAKQRAEWGVVASRVEEGEPKKKILKKKVIKKKKTPRIQFGFKNKNETLA